MIPEVILENDLKIHVFLESVASAVASAPASAVAPASRFKDPAQVKLMQVTGGSGRRLQWLVTASKL